MSKRRMNGEGSVNWEESTKRFCVQFMEHGKRRHTHYKLADGETKTSGKRNALKLLRDIRRRQDDGIQVSDASMSMGVHLRQWLKLKKPSLRPKTHDDYALMVNRYLIPRLGHIRLNKLSPEHINAAWERMRADGLSESIIEHCHSRLATSLIYAMKRKWRIDNPLAFVPKPRAGNKAPRSFSQEEMTGILNTAKSEFNGDYHAVIHTALHTGLRRNELLALTWRDVDVDLGTINITKSISRRNGETTIHRPKTDTGVRLVLLPPASSILLRAVKKQQQGDAVLFGYEVNDDTSVFIRRTGEPLLPRAVTNGFKVIAERAGHDELGYHFHETRHTHATLMLEQGAHPKVVQERLGHKDIETTLNTYSHVSMTMQKEAADKFDLGVEVNTAKE